MYTVKQGGRTDYNYKEIYVDEESDIASVDITNVCVGSIIYVISTGAIYMLNNKQQWVQQ